MENRVIPRFFFNIAILFIDETFSSKLNTWLDLSTRANIKRLGENFRIHTCLRDNWRRLVAGEIRLRLAFCEKATEQSYSRLTRCTPVVHKEYMILLYCDRFERASRHHFIRVDTSLSCSIIFVIICKLFAIRIDILWFIYLWTRIHDYKMISFHLTLRFYLSNNLSSLILVSEMKIFVSYFDTFIRFISCLK